MAEPDRPKEPRERTANIAPFGRGPRAQADEREPTAGASPEDTAETKPRVGGVDPFAPHRSPEHDEPSLEASQRYEPAEAARAEASDEHSTDALPLDIERPRRPPLGATPTDMSLFAPIIDEAEEARLKDLWAECQQRFVDEPRNAVEWADDLVTEVLTKVEASFEHTRESLEHRWDGKDRVSTDELRLAFQMYREFFHRLLAA